MTKTNDENNVVGQEINIENINNDHNNSENTSLEPHHILSLIIELTKPEITIDENKNVNENVNENENENVVVNLNPETEEDILPDSLKQKIESACQLWDLCVLPQNAIFCYQNHILPILVKIFRESSCNRFLEVCMGICANMCSVSEIATQVENEDSIIQTLKEMFLSSEDSSVLYETCRLLNTCFSTNNYSIRESKLFKSLNDNFVIEKCLFILDNSLDARVIDNISSLIVKLIVVEDKCYELFISKEIFKVVESAISVFSLPHQLEKQFLNEQKQKKNEQLNQIDGSPTTKKQSKEEINEQINEQEDQVFIDDLPSAGILGLIQTLSAKSSNDWSIKVLLTLFHSVKENETVCSHVSVMSLYNIFLNFEENQKTVPDWMNNIYLIEKTFVQKVIEHLGDVINDRIDEENGIKAIDLLNAISYILTNELSILTKLNDPVLQIDIFEVIVSEMCVSFEDISINDFLSTLDTEVASSLQFCLNLIHNISETLFPVWCSNKEDCNTIKNKTKRLIT